MKNFLGNFLPVGNGNKVTAFSKGQKAPNWVAVLEFGPFWVDKLSGGMSIQPDSRVISSRCAKNRATPLRLDSGWRKSFMLRPVPAGTAASLEARLPRDLKPPGRRQKEEGRMSQF